MRKLNPNEQKIIKELIKIDEEAMTQSGEFLQKYFFTKANKRALLISNKQKQVIYYLSPETFRNEEEKLKANRELFDLLNLLAYLKEKGLITIIASDNENEDYLLYSNKDNSRLEGSKLVFNKNGDYLDSKNPFHLYAENNTPFLIGGNLKGYYNFIYENSFGFIFPNEDLKDLVKHDFISKDDRKYKKNKKITWIGIITAWIIGLASLILPYIKKEATVKINEQQYNYILQKSEEGIQINNKILKNIKHSSIDTVKVKNKKK